MMDIGWGPMWFRRPPAKPETWERTSKEIGGSELLIGRISRQRDGSWTTTVNGLHGEYSYPSRKIAAKMVEKLAESVAAKRGKLKRRESVNGTS